MQRRGQVRELIEYWANKHEDTAEKIRTDLERYRDGGPDGLAEQVAYLLDDVLFLREYASKMPSHSVSKVNRSAKAQTP